MESGVLVNGGQGWEGPGAAHEPPQHQGAERPASALSTSSSTSGTASSNSLARSSPLLSPTNSESTAPSSYGDSGAEARMDGFRSSSSSGVGVANQSTQGGGLFRRSKSTPSLQQSDDEEGGRRTLWGWGQRPLLPPPHFYYCPNTPPRNLELRHEDIPEGVDRVKKLKKRIESLPALAKPPASRDGAQRPKSSAEIAERRRTLNGGLQPKTPPTPPYRTPSFGGSMIQINQKSTTLPLRGGGGGSSASTEKQVTALSPQGKTWSSTLPRDGVTAMYWNGISTIGRNKSRRAVPRPSSTESEEDGEVRVSPSTLERIRARGSSVTYYGGRVVKQGAPADPTLAIMEEIRRQRAVEAGKWAKGDWPLEDGEVEAAGGGRDSSYGSAESTPTPSAAPTPPLPPATPPRTPSPPAKVVSAMTKGGEGEMTRPLWSGQCSVVFDFRPGKAREGGKLCY